MRVTVKPCLANRPFLPKNGCQLAMLSIVSVSVSRRCRFSGDPLARGRRGAKPLMSSLRTMASAKFISLFGLGLGAEYGPLRSNSGQQ